MTFVSADGQIQLQTTVGGQHALVFPGIEKGRWYRAVWAASRNWDGAHFLWIRKWDEKAGGFVAGAAATDCYWQGWTWALPPPDDLWIGHDGSTDASLHFHGRLDNVVMLNFFSVPTKPANCTLQP